MKKIAKRILLGLLIATLATGVSFAYTMTPDYRFEFNNADGSLGAVVYLDHIAMGGIDTDDADVAHLYTDTEFTYVYTIYNHAFDPDSDNAPGVYAPIHAFALPVEGDAVTAYGTFGPVDAGNVTLFADFDLINVSWPLPIPGMPISEIQQGQTSDPFFFQSTYELGEVIATIRNDSEMINDVVYSATVVPSGGSGSNPVPEPATLLLLGSGLLATGGFRHLRSRKKKTVK